VKAFSKGSLNVLLNALVLGSYHDVRLLRGDKVEGVLDDVIDDGLAGQGMQEQWNVRAGKRSRSGCKYNRPYWLFFAQAGGMLYHVPLLGEGS
jgi:hypothetical protein